MGLLARSTCLLFLVAACSDDPPFQPIDTLCDELAEDICDARAGGCCAGVDPASCVQGELTRCEAELTTLEAEPLQYDSRAAAAKRRAARTVLDSCGAPPALASFFTGGLVDGTACERDAQCSGGRCTVDSRVCAPATPTLCTP
ncbi:MAG TPA: hypothetical protein VFX59_13785 [Polyangiales bacterium]|nr:hypothetical protein [Polyangiales bacterium]